MYRAIVFLGLITAALAGEPLNLRVDAMLAAMILNPRMLRLMQSQRKC
jgi:hypothetical protein